MAIMYRCIAQIFFSLFDIEVLSESLCGYIAAGLPGNIYLPFFSMNRFKRRVNINCLVVSISVDHFMDAAWTGVCIAVCLLRGPTKFEQLDLPKPKKRVRGTIRSKIY